MRSRLPFSKLLPVISLVIGFMALAVPVTLTYFNLHSIPPKECGLNSPCHKDEDASPTVPRDEFLTASFMTGGDDAEQIVLPLNLPGMPAEMAESAIARSWPDSWAPSNMSLEEWRSLTYPIFGLPFWWFAGVGFDTLLKRRHLRWWWLLLGTLFCAATLLLTCGFAFGAPDDDHQATTAIFAGCALWDILFAVFPIAWILQFRRDRGRTQMGLQDAHPDSVAIAPLHEDRISAPDTQPTLPDDSV